MRIDDVAGSGPGSHCSPRHKIPCDSLNKGYRTHVDDVAGDICQTLPDPRGQHALVRHVVGLILENHVAAVTVSCAFDPRVKIRQRERAGGAAVRVEVLDPGPDR